MVRVPIHKQESFRPALKEHHESRVYYGKKKKARKKPAKVGAIKAKRINSINPNPLKARVKAIKARQLRDLTRHSTYKPGKGRKVHYRNAIHGKKKRS
jgi:hypothetical protein